MDLLGISAAFASSPNIEMIGYLDRKAVESSNLLMGPAYAITGGDSKKSRTAIAALSQALEETGTVGFCRIVRMKNGEPKIGALLPKLEGSCDDDEPEMQGKGGRYLAFLELPFADDLQHSIDRPVPSEFLGDFHDERVCEGLIESMMLPDDGFRNEEISFPALKSHQRMVAHFAISPMDPEDEMRKGGLAKERILEASRAKPLCDFDAARAVSRKSSRHIDAFLEKFPLIVHKSEGDKKRKYWGDGND